MTVFGFVGLCFGLVGIVAHYYEPWSLVTLALAAFSGYLGFGAIVALMLFVFVRTPVGWAGVAVSAVVVVWLVAIHAPRYVAETAPTSGSDIIVMTSNLKVGHAEPDAVVNAVRAHHVDVLMLEELTPEIAASLREAGLDKLLPHSVSVPHAGGAGTGLWTKAALTVASTRSDLGFAFVTGRIESASGPITLAAVHVYGPSPSAQFPMWRDLIGEYPSALGALRDKAVIVGGDFNATLDTAQFRTILDHGYADAVEQAGAGYTPTWPADRWYPPLIAIDHVLTRNAVARSVTSLEVPGSDHRALVVAVRVPRHA